MIALDREDTVITTGGYMAVQRPLEGRMGLTVAAVIGGVATTPVVLALVHQSSHDSHHLTMKARVLLATTLALGAATLAGRHGGGGLAVSAVPLVLGVAATTVDIRELRLPNRLVVPMLVASLVTVAVVAGLSNDPVSTATRAMTAGLVAVAMMFLARFIRWQAVGWGDVKFAPSLGCYLGLAGEWPTVYLGLLLWWLLIALSALLIVVARPRHRHDPMPYAPAMLVGTFVAVVMS